MRVPVLACRTWPWLYSCGSSFELVRICFVLFYRPFVSGLAESGMYAIWPNACRTGQLLQKQCSVGLQLYCRRLNNSKYDGLDDDSIIPKTAIVSYILWCWEEVLMRSLHIILYYIVLDCLIIFYSIVLGCLIIFYSIILCFQSCPCSSHVCSSPRHVRSSRTPPPESSHLKPKVLQTMAQSLYKEPNRTFFYIRLVSNYFL